MNRLIFIDEYGTIDENLTNYNVGGRKQQNIRDNLFVINALLNASKRGLDEALNIFLYTMFENVLIISGCPSALTIYMKQG